MNRVILVGRLTRDPELRNTTTDMAVTSFSIAVNRNFKNKDGVVEADFPNIVVFNKQAENVAKYCTKGMQVAVDGRIRTRSYDDKDGTKRYVTEVHADNVEFLGSKKDREAEMNSGYVDSPSVAPVDTSSNEVTIPTADPYENFGNEITLSDNDLPF